MTAQTATVIVTAPLPSVFGYISNPEHLRYLLSDVLPRDVASRGRARPRAKWAFSADQAGHRLRWQLLAPYPAQGTLDVYGDCSISQLWLKVQVAPAEWPPAKLRTTMHTVLHRIREQIEADVSVGGQPAMLRPA
jgi:hypothetical protein